MPPKCSRPPPAQVKGWGSKLFPGWALNHSELVGCRFGRGGVEKTCKRKKKKRIIWLEKERGRGWSGGRKCNCGKKSSFSGGSYSFPLPLLSPPFRFVPTADYGLLSLFSPPSTPKGRLSRWPQKGGKSAVLWASSTADDNSASFFYARARPTTDHHHRGGIEEGLHARGRLSPGACAVRQRTQVGRSPKWLLTYSSASGGPPLLRTEKEERGREITLMLV